MLSYNPPIPFPYTPTEWGTLYPYTADLLCLDHCSGSELKLAPCLNQINTSLDITAWTQALRHHLDRALTRYLLQCLARGFRIALLAPNTSLLGLSQHVVSPAASRSRPGVLGKRRPPEPDVGPPFPQPKSEQCLLYT